MITTNIRTIKKRHEGCYEKEMEDVQIGYRCMVCGLFIHKRSDNIKKVKK